MWYVMAKAQHHHDLSDRLIRAISDLPILGSQKDNVSELLDLGADVNRHHGTLLPLHCACMVGDVDCVKLLLERGAEVNAIDGYGRGALHYAAESDVECVAELLHQGADPDIRDMNHDTPLHWAAFKDNADCVKELLEFGADVDVMDYNNDSPLSWAAYRGNYDSVKLLLQYNAKVDTQNYNGHYPVARAASIISVGLNSDKEDACLELLLRAMGQFDIRSQDGHFPDPIQRDNKLADTFSLYCSNTLSLQAQCRFMIRQSMGKTYLPTAIRKLPIPEKLQDYVLLLNN